MADTIHTETVNSGKWRFAVKLQSGKGHRMSGPWFRLRIRVSKQGRLHYRTKLKSRGPWQKTKRGAIDKGIAELKQDMKDESEIERDIRELFDEDKFAQLADKHLDGDV